MSELKENVLHKKVNGSCDVVGWWRGKTYAINTWGGGLRQHLIQDIQPSPSPFPFAPLGRTRAFSFYLPVSEIPLPSPSSWHFIKLPLFRLSLYGVKLGNLAFYQSVIFFFRPPRRFGSLLFNKHYVITWIHSTVFFLKIYNLNQLISINIRLVIISKWAKQCLIFFKKCFLKNFLRKSRMNEKWFCFNSKRNHWRGKLTWNHSTIKFDW